MQNKVLIYLLIIAPPGCYSLKFHPFRQQVEAIAFKHFGGWEGLEAEHERREADQQAKKQERHARNMTKVVAFFL